MRGKTTKLMAFLLALMMLFGAIPASAGASGEKVGVSEAGAVLELVKKLAGKIKDVSVDHLMDEAVGLAADSLLEWVFGIDTSMSDEERQYFNQILAKIQELQNAVTTLQTTIDSQFLADLLNDFRNYASPIPADTYKSLSQIDAEQKPAEDKQTERYRILTNGIGVTDWESIGEPFDDFAWHFYTAMLTPYNVSIHGSSSTLLLTQVEYEFLRQKYHWEHLALDEWYSFESYAVGLLIQTLTIEKFSLLSRIELIRNYNKDAKPEDQKSEKNVMNRLADVQQWLENIKTTFGDSTNLTWMGGRAHNPDTERYYWTPGHEMTFAARVTNQSLPREASKKVGYCDISDGKIQGITWNNSIHTTCKAIWAFWKPFFRPVQLINDSQAQLIYNDYQGNKSFYEIFMSETEGNFQGLSGDPNANDWKLIIDPNNHPLDVTFQFSLVSDWYYYVTAWFLDAKHTGPFQEAQGMTIAKYWGYSNSIFSGTDFIGIQITHTGPDNISVPLDQQVNLSMHDEGSDGWTETEGDLEIRLDKVQGSPKSVMADGKTLSEKNYSTEKRSVFIKSAYLATLSRGIHTFVVTAEKGTMTLVTRIGKQAVFKLPGSLKKLGSRAFAGIAAVNVIIPTTCREIGAGAFSGCENLRTVYLPDDVKISKGAFSGCPHVTFICSDGSAAAKYADQNGIPHHE